jgi:predicted CoA-binding protein
MSDKSVAQKLMIKEGHKVLIVHQPKGYKALLGELPKKATILKEATGPVDLVQVFVDSRKEMEELLPGLKPLVSPKGILWFTYHKGTSKHKTDINRDSIAAYAATIGMQAVAMISVDDDWSALRLKVVG